MKNLEITKEILLAMLRERDGIKPSRYIIRGIDNNCVTLSMYSEDDPYYNDMEEVIDFEKKQSAYLGIQRLGYGYEDCISKPEKPVVDPVVENMFMDIKHTNSGGIQFTIQVPINFTNIKRVVGKFFESERLGLNVDYTMLMEMIISDIAAGKYDYDVDDDDYI